MTIDIKTAEKILNLMMQHHATIAQDAFNMELTADQRTSSLIKSEAVRAAAEHVVNGIAPTPAIAAQYLAKLKSAVKVNHNKIIAGEWFNG